MRFQYWFCLDYFVLPFYFGNVKCMEVFMRNKNYLSELDATEKIAREIALLNAKAANLAMKARVQAKELTRRRDTHEKIVLGACMKKVGLDRFRRADAALSNSRTAGFDVPLLLGALAFLNAQLIQDTSPQREVPTNEELREEGARLLDGGLDI